MRHTPAKQNSAPKVSKFQTPKFIKNYQNLGISFLFVVLISLFLYIVFGIAEITIGKSGQYIVKAEGNASSMEYTFASRGVITDRNGTILVQNTKRFDLEYVPSKLSFDSVKQKFPEIADKLADYEKNHKDFKNIARTVIAHNIPKSVVIELQKNPTDGLNLKDSTVREYPFKDSFSHLLGYTGLASDTDIADNNSLLMNDIVGKNGLEYLYDKDLRGIHGTISHETDANGDLVPNGSTEIVPSQNGTNLQLSIDANYQNKLFDIVKKAVDQYNSRGGSAVLIDVKTGAVRALVSYPSYDNNLFVGGISEKDYQKIVTDPRSPMLYRPIAAQEPPGSTFKTLVASAALEEKAITPTFTVNATGVTYLSGGTPFQDYHKHVYGVLTVRDALMVSSNIFFCRTMIRLGIDKFLPYAEKFGIGAKTGIDTTGEARGRIPSPENKIWLAENGATWLDPIWYPEGDSCNSAIGQGIVLTTPLQMANVAATIANGGTVYKPYLVEQKINGDTITKTTPTIVNKDFISDQSLKVVREGMRMSVNGSRAIVGILKNVPYTVAAKTGTAEFGTKDKFGYSNAHAWVIGFYPYEKPEIAFAVLLEGGENSTRAATVMRDFMLTVYK